MNGRDYGCRHRAGAVPRREDGELNSARTLRCRRLLPWLMIPGAFVLLAVLMFNFIGDGLRDAADPYAA